MGRFDKFFDNINKATDTTVQPGDESAVADSPHNWLTGNINKVLPDSMQIPAQTVAEDKQYMQNLPEQMAGATMGSINTRFGRVLGADGQVAKAMSHADIMGHPEMTEFLANKQAFQNANPHPSQWDAAKQALINKIRGQ